MAELSWTTQHPGFIIQPTHRPMSPSTSREPEQHRDSPTWATDEVGSTGVAADGSSRLPSRLMKPGPRVQSTDEMDLIKLASRANPWHWDETDKSSECVISDNKMNVCIHPNCSESAAACRGSQPFKRNGNYYYWELLVSDKTYGTSVMFGLCTKRQRLHVLDYCNLIGLDENGWSLSHKGLIWHNGHYRQYTQMFPPNEPIKIGLLLDTMRGELSYFMDGKNLGVAFCGLNDLTEDLYPVVGSTAKCTRISIVGSYCGYVSLLESVIKHSRNSEELIDYLKRYQLPRTLINYLVQADDACVNAKAIKTIRNDTNPQEKTEADTDDDNSYLNQIQLY